MMQDDEAVVTMVDSNLQREQITPSEKAYAYKMKHDAIKKKAGRKNRYVLYCVKKYVQISVCKTDQKYKQFVKQGFVELKMNLYRPVRSGMETENPFPLQNNGI